MKTRFIATNSKRLKLLVLGLMTMSMMHVVGCKKGDMGPQGEQGIQGEKGDKGDTGDKGNKGDKGTANVIYSEWSSITFTNSGGVYSGTINAPKLTTDVLNGGEIAVYERTMIGLPPTTTTSYSKLPYTNGTKWVKVDLEVGKIILRSNVNSISSYRYVLIPGGMEASAAAHVDLGNYNAVKRFYHIRE